MGCRPSACLGYSSHPPIVDSAGCYNYQVRCACAPALFFGNCENTTNGDMRVILNTLNTVEMFLICVSHVFHLCSNVPSHIWQLRHIWAHLISPMCSNVFCAQMCPNVPQCVEMCLCLKCVSNVFQMCSNVFCAH